MNCPSCGESLIVLELHGTEIDYCVFCKGIWLDAGELEFLLSGSSDSEPLLSSIHQADIRNEIKIRCPLCNRKMEKVICGTREHVIIDRCKKGHGFWFEHGELREIIRMAGSGGDSRITALLAEILAFEMQENH
ncbi:MAG: zf-TFIIB domain-containing protein [Bacteroidales bacterium]|nr:zf-TFIIB domain-containing protein [Bacteroidales bacterium]